MGQLPEGTVTFLFSDIEGSTRMARDLGDAWPTVLEQHRALLREAFATHSGHEVSTEGDGFFVAFERASDAVPAAIDAQRALGLHDWGDRPALHVRMGIHTGAAELVDDDYVGVTVHEAARVASAAHGGQIVISEATRQLCGDVDGSTTVDLGLHNLKDLPTPVRLHQVCHPGLPERFPSLRTSAETPHNLPVRLTSLVGRDEELRVVEKLVGDHRLVTLAGAGGAGKTRLAVEVASRLLSSFPDGVWFVELATVRESALVPQAVADVLGIRVVEDSRDLATLIPAFLEDRRSLLVLDNCEHVIVAAAELADRVMRGTPATHILATSREALSVEGEHARRVPSLDLPGDGADPLESSAVRLFFDRAEAGDAMVDPSPENLDAAVQICERLDGMPLAIELAAARARSLTPVQIAERLDDRFRLLTGGSRTALPRQQTLGAMIDWSHDLLNEDECTLFRRLAVFSGGFTLEAAEDVCAGGRLPEGAVLDLLDDLVAKSLVVPPTATPARYRYLETIRQYARQKLLEAGEIEALRDAHLRWFLDFAETAAPRLREADQAVWLDAVAAEHDNLRGALEWAVDAPHRGDAAPRLVSALWLFWWIRGHWQEGRTWAEQALAVSPSEDPLLRAHALWAMGFFARFLGDTERAEAPLGEAFAIWEQHGDRAGLARCYYALGHCAATALHVDQARDHYRNGARLARDVGDYLTLGWCLLLDGALPGTPPPEREALFLEALAIARQNGDLWNTAMALNNLGAVAAARNDHGRASTLLRESLAIAREIGDSFSLPTTLLNLGTLAWRDGDLDDAEAFLLEVEQICRQSGEPTRRASAMAFLAGIQWMRDDDHTARMWADRAQAIAREQPIGGGGTQVANWLAWLSCRAGRFREAHAYAAEAERQARSEPFGAQLAAVLHTVGEVERAMGGDRADELFEEAEEAARSLAIPHLLGTALVGRAWVALDAGEPVRATTLLKEALPVLQLGDELMDSALLAAAEIAFATGRVPTAARFLGAARKAFTALTETYEVARADQLHERLAATLGTAVLEAEFATGASADREELTSLLDER